MGVEAGVCAQDLADLKAPGFPWSKRKIAVRADREAWPFQEVRARGGVRRDYIIRSLPEILQQALTIRNALAAHPQVRQEAQETAKIANLRKNASLAPAKAGKVSKAVATPTPALPHKGGGSAPAPSISGNIMGHITAQQSALRATRLRADGATARQAPGPSPSGEAENHEMAAPGPDLPPGPVQLVELPAYRVLTPAAEARADARLAVLRAFEDWLGQQNMGLGKALKGFSALYNDGDVALEGWILKLVPTVSPNSLRNWAQKSKQDGTAALAGKYDHRKGTGVIDSNPVLLDFCVALIMELPHLSATKLAHFIEVDHKRVIPKRTVQSWMKNWRAVNASILQHVSNPDQHRSHRGAGFGSQSEGITRVNQLWEIDATPIDLMLTDGRYSVVGVIDVYTRRALCLVTKTPRAVANTALLRKAILEWGLPEALKTDNGSDFTAKHMVRALRDLDIRHDLCLPFQPQAKPHVERFFGTLTRDLFEVLPGYIGHDVAGRKAIESRRAFAQRFGEGAPFRIAEMSSDEFAPLLDLYMKADYPHRRHGGLAQKTPHECARESRDIVKRVLNERALDILLAPAPDGDGFRVVGKKGVSVRNHFYISPELGALVGERVQVRLDDTDAGKIFCYALGGAFLCIADCPEISGVSQRDVAMMARALTTEALKEGRKYVRDLIKQHRPEEIARRSLDYRVAAQANILGFPKPSIATSTPALDFAGEAALALDNHGRLPPPTPLSAEDMALADAAIAKMEARGQPDNVVALPRMGANGRPFFTTDFAFAEWALANQALLDAQDYEVLDGILLGPAMQVQFGDEAVADARTRRSRRHLTA